MASRTAAATSSILNDLHQPQHLHELALAGLAHASLKQAAERRELPGQLPIGERGCLVERIGFLLDQRQVVQRIEHEVLALVGAGMARNRLGAAGDDDLMHVATDQHLLVPVGRRH